MKISTAIKTLLATSVLAAAGFANATATSVSGYDQDGNIVVGLGSDPTRGSYIDIDDDWQTPSPCLASLQEFRIYVPWDPNYNAGWWRHGEFYGSVSTPPEGPTWGKEWSDCGLEPVSVEGDFDNGFEVTYVWGATLTNWQNGICDAIDSNDGADYYLGTYTGANNPRWDCAALVVTTTPTFVPTSILLWGREYLSASPVDTVEFVYSLVTP